MYFSLEHMMTNVPDIAVLKYCAGNCYRTAVLLEFFATLFPAKLQEVVNQSFWELSLYVNIAFLKALNLSLA